MTHKIQLVQNGWTLEFLADESDQFKTMLTNFAGQIKGSIDDYVVRVPLQIVRRMGDYVKEKIDDFIEEYQQKITTKEDLSGCVFQKYVKTGVHPEYGQIRAEIRFEESHHDDEIEVEGLVFKNIDEETREGSIILFRETEFKRKRKLQDDEPFLEFKGRVSTYTIDLMTLIDKTYFRS